MICYAPREAIATGRVLPNRNGASVEQGIAGFILCAFVVNIFVHGASLSHLRLDGPDFVQGCRSACR